MGLFKHEKIEFQKAADKDDSKYASFQVFLNISGVFAFFCYAAKHNVLEHIGCRAERDTLRFTLSVTRFPCHYAS